MYYLRRGYEAKPRERLAARHVFDCPEDGALVDGDGGIWWEMAGDGGEMAGDGGGDRGGSTCQLLLTTNFLLRATDYLQRTRVLAWK